MFEPNHVLIDRFYSAEDFKIERKIQVNCDTLDNMLTVHDIKDVDFIKLDTQGSELLILQGAENLLSSHNVFGIDVELEFSQMYKDQPLFGEVDAFLRNKGFTLFDIKIPLGRKTRKTGLNGHSKGQALWTRVVYFRDFSAMGKGFPESYCSKKAYKSIALAELHGFPDFSLELLEFYRSKGIIDSTVYDDVRQTLLIQKSTHPEVQFIKRLRVALKKYFFTFFITKPINGGFGYFNFARIL